MSEVTLTKAELKMLKESGGSIKATLRSLQARTGVNLPEAKGIIEAAKEALRKAEAPTRPPPVDDNEDEVLCPGKPPVEKPEPRLLFRAKAGKHNPRVSLSEVEAMTRGEAEKGALAEAVASVTRWGIPLTIQLNTKDRKGHKGSGRRVRISRE